MVSSSTRIIRVAVVSLLMFGLGAFVHLAGPSGTGAQVVPDQILDRIEIVEIPGAAEIHILFNARALYLRHTPAEEGDLVRIMLDFPGIARRFSRELAASPPSDLIPKFSVIFPDQATNGLSIQFEKPVKFKVSQRDIKSASRIVVTVKTEKPVAPTPAPPVVEAPKPAAPKGQVPAFEIPQFRPGTDVEQYAAELQKLGGAALAAENYEKAIEILNLLLNLPPNKQSQEAQEMVGVARERSGEFSKAKAEYEHYLRTYPTGEGAVRVQQRLAALSETKTKFKEQEKRKQKKIDELQLYGSVYQYYYGGFSQMSIMDKIANTTTKIQNHDQSMLQSAFDVTGRYRKDEYDTKVVVRGTHSYDMMATTDARRNIERLRALYFEHSSKDSYFLRVGRQPGNIGGILDFRFDGAWFRYTAIPQLLNLNVVGGQPRQFSLAAAYVPDDPRNFVAGLDRYFYGFNVDVGPIAQAWSGNVYVINQMVNGVVDRRAVGTEARYSSNGINAFSLVDYDISYNVLNVAMLNGTWVTPDTTYTVLFDHRRTPYLQTTNALFGTPGASLSMINLTNESLLREQARAVTATSDLFMAGVLHSVSKNWQLGGDVRLNRISGTSATKCLVVLPGSNILFLNPNAQSDAFCSLQALPGTGNIWTFSGQAIGTNVPFENNTVVFNASYIDNQAYKGQSVSLNSLTRLSPQLQANMFLLFYHQTTNLDVEMYRVTPMLRMDYRIFDNWTIEGSGGVERTITNSSTQKDWTMREFFFIGLRWDFS